MSKSDLFLVDGAHSLSTAFAVCSQEQGAGHAEQQDAVDPLVQLESLAVDFCRRYAYPQVGSRVPVCFANPN